MSKNLHNERACVRAHEGWRGGRAHISFEMLESKNGGAKHRPMVEAKPTPSGLRD